ncbi:MAG TPA: aldehyde dehydrogenase family protein [Fimbriimonadaceae bacterium]|nr:aldehyde dehydrogenase [Armatimonadota bacterium]HRI74015.1 aldehyde dehydrogenase family protein [Fimbriimonadaceae bacterium]
MIHRELLLNGVFLGGPCDQGIGKEIAVSPWDGRRIGTFAEGGWAEMDAALDCATQAFEVFRKTSMAERGDLLARISEAVTEREDELAELLVLEVGKPITAARAEVKRTALTFGLAADLARSWEPESVDLSYDPRGSNYRAEVRRRPVGPVLAIVPWNWPYNLAAHKIAPALLAGCPVVLKPSTAAALCTLSLARLIHECGCPAGVVNAIACPNAIAEKAVRDPRAKFVSFTGSEAVGWRIKELVPDRKVSLELGGDASAVICEDADLDLALPLVLNGAYAYAGQICISVQHLRVHESRVDEVVARLVPMIENLGCGDPALESTVVGPVINRDAVDKIEAVLASAVAGGARILAGGERTGNVISPTLIADVPSGHTLTCDEVFGPVLTLSTFANDAEAMDQVNSGRFGLQAGGFTISPDRAELFIENLEVGGIVINDVPTVRFDAMPYGGVKRSGFGREGVRYTYEEMTEPLAVVTRQV